MADVLKPHHLPLVQHFTDDGLFDGSSNMAVDGTVAKTFYVQAPSNWIFFVHRVIFQLEDGSPNSWTPAKFGNLTALTNGVTLKYQDDNEVWCHFSTDQHPIKTNAEFGQIMYDIRREAFGGGGTAYLSGRMTFTRFGRPLVLDGNGDNQRLLITIQDNLSNLDAFEALVQGEAVKGGRGFGHKLYRTLPQSTAVGLWY